MEILTYINFIAESSEAAQTGDNFIFVFLSLLCLVLFLASSLIFVLKSKKISSIFKKILGIGLPSIFLVLTVPLVASTISYAAGSSASVNAIVDKDNGIAYVENGTIQNTDEETMQLIVSNSQAVNAGLNMPGLQNANLKVTVEGNVVFDGNPFDDYQGNMDLNYELSPGQTASFSTELTGLDTQTAQSLEGSGSSIQIRFKFYYSMVDHEYGPELGPAPVADYLYESEYKSWDEDKCNFICECIAKRQWWYDVDSPEYKEYLRKEWGCNEQQIAYIIEIRKYLEGSNPYLCTSCRYGNLIGRNFDWAYDDLDEYVIRTQQTPEHFQSIGVVSSFFPQLLQDMIGMPSMLPMLTMDGINQNGVAININVVPTNFDDTIGTNPGAERLCAGVIPRFVLDNATSAKHAVELLKSKDIFTISLSEFHFMISDAEETYIVETVHNKLVVLKHNKDDATAMANFHVTNSQYYSDYDIYYGDPNNYGPYYSKGSMGIERYDKAITNLKAVNSLDSGANSMVDHMKPIYYEHVYNDGYDFWSDKNGMPSAFPGSKHVFSYYDKDDEEAEKWASERKATFDHCKQVYDNVHKTEDANGWRLGKYGVFNGVTQTVHASCYDISTKKLVVNVQERDVSFHFTLNGGFREQNTSNQALDLYVNGDNVGLATSCAATDSSWSYVGGVLTLNDTAVYSITGSDASQVTIQGPGEVGYFVNIPKIENAYAQVFVDSNTDPAKGRKGVRAVPKDSKITIKFVADSGYVFINGEEEPDTLTQVIDSISGNITFGTADYPLPVTKQKDVQ